MESKVLICKNCKAPLLYDDENVILKCPHCGSTEWIEETDAVAIERIRAAAYKNVELGKKNIEKETVAAVQQYELEKKRLSFVWVRILVILAVVSLIGLGIFKGVSAIVHRNDIKIPLNSVSYCERNYNDTIDLLQDAGFLNVSPVAIEDLGRGELDQEGIVTQVSINGNTVFKANQWFSKDSLVKVTFHTLDPDKADQLQVPMSAWSCVDKDYQSVLNEFTSAGFDQIETNVISDLTKDQEDKVGIITEITVNGNPDFAKGEWVNYGTLVSITYHALDAERATDVQIPLSSDQTSDQNYIVLFEDFRKAGFTNIKVEPDYSLILGKDEEGKVVSVTLGGADIFFAKKWVPVKTEVIIKYKSKKLAYSGKDYRDIIHALNKIGFSGVNSIALDDLNPSEDNKAGKVDSVLIDGIELSDADLFSLDGKAIIYYHSVRELTDTRLAITQSSSQLSKSDYQTVVHYLSELGFTNISTIPLEDITSLNKAFIHQGDVKDITIGGKTKFKEGEIFDTDTEIVIRYHTEKPKK